MSKLTSPERHQHVGIRPHLGQFLLLVVQVAFVGALWGIERTVLPIIAKSDFGIASATTTLSFILAFGLTKAPANFIAGRLADRFGRRRVLLGGWLLGLPVPLMIAVAPSWGWIVSANLLLGAQQGVCWSTSIFMKVDVSGRRNSGLAIGINEFAGYGGTAVTAYATGVLAASAGSRVAPFLLGEVLAVAGLVVALLLGKETHDLAFRVSDGRGAASVPPTKSAFASIAQAGFVVKLGDTTVWGLLPLFLTAQGIPVGTMGAVVALYPATWAVLQPVTGVLSDKLGRRGLISSGMLLQGVGFVVIGVSHTIGGWLLGIVVLGAGTAAAYPTLIAAAGDTAERHAARIGQYRFWRDMGFVVGAICVGLLVDHGGAGFTLAVLAAVASASALVSMVGLRRSSAAT